MGVTDRLHCGDYEHLIDVAVSDQIAVDPTSPTHQPTSLASEAGDDDLQQKPPREFVGRSKAQKRPHHLGGLLQLTLLDPGVEFRESPGSSQDRVFLLPPTEVTAGRGAARKLGPLVVEDIEDSF